MSSLTLTRFKRCTCCGLLLPSTDSFFGAHKLGKHGRVSHCRMCTRLKNRVPWERHRSNKARIKEKECRECGIVKPRSEFHERKTGKKAGLLSSVCKACDAVRRKQYREHDTERAKLQRRRYYQANRRKMIERQKRYYEANAEAIAVYQKRYREEHHEERQAYNKEYHKRYYADNREKYAEKARKREALRQGHKHRFLKADVQKKYEEQRGKCYWCAQALNGRYEIDHIIPLSKGGPDHSGNICCACQPCNRSKHNKMPWEFSDRLF